jgi:hypothetical protein
MEIFVVAHVDYIYDEIFNELEKFHRLGNEFVDDFFQRVMHIYYRFPQRDKPIDQEIFDWFSYLVSEGYKMGNQIISHSQVSNLTTKNRGHMISNQHFVIAMGESLPEILNPLDPDYEPSIISSLENNNYIFVCNKPRIKHILSF